jgi:hypothetical protein
MEFYRIKERTFEQMEEDLANKKLFDMTIEIKELSLLLPEYGLYTQFHYSIFLFLHLFDFLLVIVKQQSFILIIFY